MEIVVLHVFVLHRISRHRRNLPDNKLTEVEHRAIRVVNDDQLFKVFHDIGSGLSLIVVVDRWEPWIFAHCNPD